MDQEVFEQSFSVSRPARLSLGNIRGSVLIQPQSGAGSEDGQIMVKAVKHLESGDAQHTEIRMAQEADGSVSITTRYETGDRLSTILAARQPCKVDYTVSIPSNCILQLNCVSSSASVRGLQGEFSLKMVSGALALEDLAGKILVNTVSGDVSGERLSGQITLDTTSGKVSLYGSNFAAIEASSISGSLQFQTPLLESPYRFKSVSGNVDLAVPSDTHCTVECSSLSGHFSSDLPVTRKGSQTYEVQGGGPRVHFNTVSGVMRLLLSWVGNQVDDSQVQPAGENLEVLDRIERGELSVEEALKALKK